MCRLEIRQFLFTMLRVTALHQHTMQVADTQLSDIRAHHSVPLIRQMALQLYLSLLLPVVAVVVELVLAAVVVRVGFTEMKTFLSQH
jgi:hypothetical protein